MADGDLARCTGCGAVNRLPRGGVAAGRKAVCGRCKAPLVAAAGPVTVTDATFATIVEGAALPVLLDLWAPWCGPCRTMAPILEQLAAELAGRVVVAKLNVDEQPETAARLRVQGIPTLVAFKAGREVDRLVGLHPKAEIVRRLESLLP